MVDILPLRGIRYSDEANEPSVYAPPYDVIDDAGREKLLADNARNAVLITLGKKGDEGFYTEAEEALTAWLREGVLMRDDEPAFYGYEQRFSVGDGPVLIRRGFLGRVRLSAWGNGIHRHERTRLGPRKDRLRLMRAMNAQMSPVFGLFQDPDGAIMSRLNTPENALLDADIDAVHHVFWRITDDETIDALVAAMRERDIIIADGHHRYETALAYRNERHGEAGDEAGDQPHDFVLMYMASVDDPGMLVLATHRVVSLAETPDWDATLASLGEQFDVSPAPEGVTLTEAIAANAEGPVTIGAILGEAGEFVLKLKDVAGAHAVAERTGFSPELAGLDVVVLQNLILDDQLGITPQALAEGEQVAYTIHEDEAREVVASGQAQAAFILNPTGMGQIWDASIEGVTMPQKSTYFYPKLLTGLVFNPLDSE